MPVFEYVLLGPGSRSLSQRLGFKLVKRDATFNAHIGNRRNQRRAHFEHYSLDHKHTCGRYGGIRSLQKRPRLMPGPVH